jgi:hypothetical protein
MLEEWKISFVYLNAQFECGKWIIHLCGWKHQRGKFFFHVWNVNFHFSLPKRWRHWSDSSIKWKTGENAMIESTQLSMNKFVIRTINSMMVLVPHRKWIQMPKGKICSRQKFIQYVAARQSLFHFQKIYYNKRIISLSFSSFPPARVRKLGGKSQFFWIFLHFLRPKS